MSNNELSTESSELLKKYNGNSVIEILMIFTGIFFGGVALLGTITALFAFLPYILSDLLFVSVSILTLGLFDLFFLFVTAFSGISLIELFFAKNSLALIASAFPALGGISAGLGLVSAVTIGVGLVCKARANKFKEQYFNLEREGINRKYDEICKICNRLEKIDEKIKKLNTELEKICKEIVAKEDIIKKIENYRESSGVIEEIKEEIHQYKQSFVEKCDLIETENKEIPKQMEEDIKKLQSYVEEFRHIIIERDKQCAHQLNDISNRYAKLLYINTPKCKFDNSINEYYSILRKYNIEKRMNSLGIETKDTKLKRQRENLDMENVLNERSKNNTPEK